MKRQAGRLEGAEAARYLFYLCVFPCQRDISSSEPGGGGARTIHIRRAARFNPRASAPQRSLNSDTYPIKRVVCFLRLSASHSTRLWHCFWCPACVDQMFDILYLYVFPLRGRGNCVVLPEHLCLVTSSCCSSFSPLRGLGYWSER